MHQPTVSKMRLYVFVFLGGYLFPLSLCFGPVFLLLGGLIIINAALGFLLPGMHTDVMVYLQGGSKIGFGAALLFFPPYELTK